MPPIPETHGAVDTQVVTVTCVTHVNLHHESLTITVQKSSVFAQYWRVEQMCVRAAVEWSWGP